ncbi:sulfotransferase family protein [Skermania pinensis]|uniref:sulfotransferase family protein n=1 Tax=Skermania pinensis TaxID=39122 RepID=UPI0014700073|nr:sulfotransferase [Skermania piniformis]
MKDGRQYTIAYDLFIQQRLNRYHGISGLARAKEFPLWLRNQTLPHYFVQAPRIRRALRTLNGPRVLPDFACIGPAKGGTSELASYLMQHPSVATPLTKETLSPIPEDWRIYGPTVREFTKLAARTGHARHGYYDPRLHDTILMHEFHRIRPDGKVILMLRNPVDRAYSQFKWDIFIAGSLMAAHTTSYADYIELAFDRYPHAFPNHGYPILPTGIYVNAVRRWLDRFGPDNVMVFAAEEFFADIPGTLCRVHDFLDLPAVPPTIRPAVNQNPLPGLPPRDPETDRRLAEFFAPWNEQLYELLDRDLGWNTPATRVREFAA